MVLFNETYTDTDGRNSCMHKTHWFIFLDICLSTPINIYSFYNMSVFGSLVKRFTQKKSSRRRRRRRRTMKYRRSRSPKSRSPRSRSPKSRSPKSRSPKSRSSRRSSKRVNSWARSIKSARKQLGIRGFVKINRGSQGKRLYKLAKQIHSRGR